MTTRRRVPILLRKINRNAPNTVPMMIPTTPETAPTPFFMIQKGNRRILPIMECSFFISTLT